MPDRSDHQPADDAFRSIKTAGHPKGRGVSRSRRKKWVNGVKSGSCAGAVKLGVNRDDNEMSSRMAGVLTEGAPGLNLEPSLCFTFLAGDILRPLGDNQEVFLVDRPVASCVIDAVNPGSNMNHTI